MSDAPVLDVTAVARLQRIGGTKLVRQLIEMYLSLGAERLSALANAAAANDAHAVERAAHNLKSSAGNVGAMRLMEAAAVVEGHAAEGRIEVDVVQRIPQEYADSAEELRALLEDTVE